MEAMPTIHWQPMALTEGMKGCGACHKIGDQIRRSRSPSCRKTGSRFGIASCDACHTRHTFSVEEARSPQACETCHMGFDHPQWEMYSSSKHGVRNELKQLKIQTPDFRRSHLPDLPHAGRQSRGAHRLGISGGAFAACRKTSSGPRTEPPSCKRLACWIPTASPPRWLDVVKAADLARLDQASWQAERDKMLKTCNQCHSGNFAKAATSVRRRHDQERRPPDGGSDPQVAGLYKDGLLPKTEELRLSLP